MEYKLNQLATKWEEFRTSFIDQEDFKKAIDLVTQLLDKAMNLDPTRAAMIIPFAVLFAKTFVEEIFHQFQASKNNFAQLGAMAASGAIGTGMSKLSPSSLINKGAEFFNNKANERAAQTNLYKQEISELLSRRSIYWEGVSSRKPQIEALRAAESSIKDTLSLQRLNQQQIKNLQQTIKSTGLFSDEQLSKTFKQLKIDPSRTSRKIDDTFVKDFNEQITGKLRWQIEKLNGQTNEYKESLKANGEQIRQNIKAAKEEQNKTEKNTKISNQITGFGTKWGAMIDQSVVQGTVQGLQQVGSAAGMMASMLIAGSKATDTLNIGLTMLVMQGISSSINAISSLIPFIQAKNVAENASKVASEAAAKAESEHMIVRLANGKAASIATEAEVSETLAKKSESIAENVNTLETEANTASKNANTFATTLMTAAIAALVIVIAAATIALIKLAIEQKKKTREDALAKTSIGENTKALEENKKTLANVSEKLKEYREELDKTKKEVDLFTQAEEYNRKAFLTEDELKSRNELWNQLAEIYPELVSYYDKEGNAILEVGAAWDSVAESARQAYFEQQRNYSIESVRAAALQVQNQIINRDILKDVVNRWNEDIEFGEKFKRVDNSTTNKAEEFFKKFGQTGKWYEYIPHILSLLVAPTIDLPEIVETAENWEYTNSSIEAEIKKAQNRWHDTDAYSEYMNAIAMALAESGEDTDFKDLHDPLKIEEKLLEKAKNDKDFYESWNKAIENLPSYITTTWETEAQRDNTKYVNEFNKTLNTATKDALKSGSEYFEEQDENVQDLMLGYVIKNGTLTYDELVEKWEQAGKKEDLSNFITQYYSDLFGTDENFEELEKELKQKFDAFSISQYKTILAANQTIQEQGEALREAFKTAGEGEEPTIYDIWLAQKQVEINAAKEQLKSFGELIGEDVKVDEIYGIIQPDAESKVQQFYASLGEVAQRAFLENLEKVSETRSWRTKWYAEGMATAAQDYGLAASQSAMDYLAAFDVSDISSTTYESDKAGFVNQIWGKAAQDDIYLAKEKIGDFFDEYINLSKKAGLYNPVENLVVASEHAIEVVGNITEVLESNSDLLKKFMQRGQGVIEVDPKEVKKLQAMFTSLSELEVGAIDSATLNATLEITEQGAKLDTDALQQVLLEYVSQGEALLKNKELNKENKEEIIQTINYAKVLLGVYKTIGDILDQTGNAISSFSSAAKEQIDQGYLSSSTIKSLGDAFNALGLQADFDKNHGFINEKLQLDQKALYDYWVNQMIVMEETGKLNGMTEEQLLIWQALKKELYIANLELQNEAKNTDEVVDAWKDYNNQLDTVKDKQDALNEKIKAYNKLLYGDELRKSGLDLLYNYDEAISTFNDELTRTKDNLSDAKTIQDATAAFEQYSAATHRLIVEEKAKQEELQRGLNEYARMIEHGQASYTDTQTGRIIGINFGDYAKFDQTTGKYMLNQTLLNRARFNDSYKDLIEENIETYNKYVDEYKKSQDEVLKNEKELQEQRKSALKAYSDYEKSIADELKNQYQEEVDNLKDKYDAMKEEDDDYIDALREAIDKQRKLRDRESKYEDLAKKERKLSLISRDTSNANLLQQRQLEEEIQKDRQSLLDEQVDSIIEGMEKLYESQEETRNTEIELKEAIIDNTALLNSQAEQLAASFTTPEDYIDFMSMSKEFTELTYAQQLEQIEEYRDTYGAAAAYTAMQNMDAAAKTGDFIQETITTTGEEIAFVVADTSSAFIDEVSRSYWAVNKEVHDSLDSAVKDIADAKQALTEAIEKLDEYARKARELEEKRNYQADLNLGNSNPGADYTPSMYAPSDLSQNPAEAAIQQYHKDKLFPISRVLFGSETTDKEAIINYVEKNYDGNNGQVRDKIRTILTDIIGHDSKEIGRLSWQGRLNLFKEDIKKFESGGLVDFTGPAWVDGTKSAPEAFLNPEDTRRIGEAARILSNLPIFNSYGEANETITNNNGNVSIEINLNVDKLSSEIDVNEMLNRVKEEIVSVARPAGINTILTQQ